MSYQNIPNELKQLTQWVCWKYELTDDGKQTKIPYNPRAPKYRASHNDPRTWGAFDEAVNASWNGFSGIGFVFTANDPYCGIDLDATDDAEAFSRHKLIYDKMNSYSELSPSGNGLHIIVKAHVPHGRKRAGIEVYYEDRYFTFTGNIYQNHSVIINQQELVTTLWQEMGEGAQANHYAGDAAPSMFDEELFTRITQAYNGDKFLKLWNGEWNGEYPSHSDADLALMNFLAFHSKNRAQISRMFRASALGKRDKAKRDKYIEYTIDKAFDQTLPPIDMSFIIDQVNATIAANKPKQNVTTLHEQPKHDGIDIDLWRNVDPPGLLKDIAEFIYQAAPRPVREIALTAAIGMLAGVAGRAFNVSGTGLNLYIMMLAETGRGKEAMANGINKLASAVVGKDFPAFWDFIGPADMASGSGLLKHLAERPMPSMVALTGEIGLRLQQMSQDNAIMAESSLRRVLLDLYAKSGAGQVLRPTVYSDKKNNVELIHSPNFTWIGESTPSEFYKSLNETQIASGLIPRFLTIEYTGIRVADNERAASAFPAHNLVQRFRDLGTTAIELNQSGNVINVSSTQEAKEKLGMFSLYCDNKINISVPGPLDNLWNRAHIKVLKLSALLAVSHNHHSPLIDALMVDWSISLVMTDTLGMLKKFENGEVGTGVQNEAFRAIAKVVIKIIEGGINLNATETALRNSYVISRSTFHRYASKSKAFVDDKRLFGETIEECIKQGALSRMSKMDAYTLHHSNAELFQVANAQWFYERIG